jgi:hypothetical protein
VSSTIKSHAPKAVPHSGKKEDLINYAIRLQIEGQDRPYENVSYGAVVLYSSYISESKFREKYDISFVNYILESLGRGTDSNLGAKTIIESIVYIPEICGCLPRPPDSEGRKFYEELNKLTPLNNSEGFDKIIADEENKSQIQDAIKYLEMIKRYPRAYYLEDSENGKQLKPHSLNSTIRVRFPYSYDVYAGIVVGNIGN